MLMITLMEQSNKKIPSKKNKIKINRSNSKAPFNYKFRNNKTVYLMNLIKWLKKLGKKSIKNLTFTTW